MLAVHALFRFGLALSLVLPGLSHADASSPGTLACTGTVFIDRDNDGKRDKREKGLAGVAISDGETIVRSDSRGRYALAARPARSVFLIKPAGLVAALRPDGLPDTWINLQPEAGPKLRYGGVPPSAVAGCRDFALRPAPKATDGSLDVLVFGDPQLKSSVDADYYARYIVGPLQVKPAARLGITLGDLVNDDLSLFPALKATDARLGLPWLHAPGNHDIDFDAPRDELSLDSFRDAFGPDTYAWEESQANFIVLDDVIYLPGQQPQYIGGLRESQFAFLQAYLATAPKDRLLVLSMHIHLYDAVPGVENFRKADRERLFALLQPFPNVLVLSAHSHKQLHVFHDATTGWHGAKPLHEYNVGAACGTYWTGVKDAEGIPASTMNDGTPNGYARMRVENGKVDLRWFAARAPLDYQINLHGPKVLRRGEWPGTGLFANVFMGHAGTLVEMRIDDGPWKPMKHVLQADPAMLRQNLLDDAADALRGYDRAPEAVPSTHLWRLSLPTDLDPGMHKVQVRAVLDGYGEARAETSYRLDVVAP
ncbi:MAG: calcineurin-like phosphoesterase family protein [Gammaproteobacteria bacterium]|nr:calcineurin-like phosphoesterase family protein [Gammaproteobacteria bacterium]